MTNLIKRLDETQSYGLSDHCRGAVPEILQTQNTGIMRNDQPQ